MRKRYRRVTAALAAVGLLAGACDSSASGSGDSGSGPIRIAVMAILTGPNHSVGWDNAFKLAVDEINASGGILGRQVEYKEFDTGLTPQGAADATNLALEYQPNLLLGYSVSAGLKASASAINNAGIPVIQGTRSALTSPDSLDSKLTFRIVQTNDQFALAGMRYLTEQAGVKSMMLINTQDAAPTEGADNAQTQAAKAGVRTERRGVSPTVTDLTEPILAAKGMDAINEWGYPTTDALTVKTAAANGYTGQIMTASASNAVRSGLIPASLLTDKVHAAPWCAPDIVDTPAAKKFTQAYTAKYGEVPTESTYSAYYDALYIFKTVAEQGKSIEPDKIADGLAKVDYQGACGEEKTDAHHNMLHSVPILSFPGGKTKLDLNVTGLESGY
ncbi:ABC transporter substrate-binding protein [Amycolatopsis sp. GM8]|uniref:ABC transporter substrate-binding protein n=1 Tax=Amycolatopsis sp. GM8 TaxID=2896530 RepID=UPI001F27951F|nr:ABC transporter substrate-binding protein [Amycolatopsis sp. GM8]